MQSYLVEVYLPRRDARNADAASRSVRAAVAALAETGVTIRHVRTTFLPDDETCFHLVAHDLEVEVSALVEAETAQAVGELCRKAGLGHARVVAALET